MSPIKDSEVRPLMVKALIFVAVCGNGFFIKRLVDKIDKVDDIERTQIEMRSDIRVIKWRLGIASRDEVMGPHVQFKTKGDG